MRLASTQDAADLAGVSRTTVFRWLADERLTRYRVPGSNATRVDLDELIAVMRGDG